MELFLVAGTLAAIFIGMAVSVFLIKNWAIFSLSALSSAMVTVIILLHDAYTGASMDGPEWSGAVFGFTVMTVAFALLFYLVKKVFKTA